MSDPLLQTKETWMNVGSMRTDYTKGKLAETNILNNPINQFQCWLKEAIENPLVGEANAMTLATTTKEGFPNARVVLLKGLNERGFMFYTNYESAKGKELQENPNAALLFYWHPLQRTVRIQGTVSKLSEEESDAYFQSRPYRSRIAAIASNQDEVIPNRECLETKFNKLIEQYQEGSFIPRPKHWGGYILSPTCMEFWQGRESRLHDRIIFTRVGTQEWKSDRLAP